VQGVEDGSLHLTVRPWIGSIKPSLQHFQFCLFELSLGIPIFSILGMAKRIIWVYSYTSIRVSPCWLIINCSNIDQIHFMSLIQYNLFPSKQISDYWPVLTFSEINSYYWYLSGKQKTTIFSNTGSFLDE
jgi:hypothetical protein